MSVCQQRDISALCPPIQVRRGPVLKRQDVCKNGFYLDSDVTGSPLLPLFLAVLELGPQHISRGLVSWEEAMNLSQ
ncbi:hypothetical protein CRENBAI_009709, partial [Crenichthys baileyi]